MKVAQSCRTLCNPMDYMVHGIHCRKEDINISPLESNWNQDIVTKAYHFFSLTLLLYLPLFVLLKKLASKPRHNGSLTQVHHLFSELAFWIESLFFAPTIGFIGLPCCKKCDFGLSNTVHNNVGLIFTLMEL